MITPEDYPTTKTWQKRKTKKTTLPLSHDTFNCTNSIYHRRGVDFLSFFSVFLLSLFFSFLPSLHVHSLICITDTVYCRTVKQSYWWNIRWWTVPIASDSVRGDTDRSLSHAPLVRSCWSWTIYFVGGYDVTPVNVVKHLVS